MTDLARKSSWDGAEKMRELPCNNAEAAYRKDPSNGKDCERITEESVSQLVILLLQGRSYITCHCRLQSEVQVIGVRGQLQHECPACEILGAERAREKMRER